MNNKSTMVDELAERGLNPSPKLIKMLICDESPADCPCHPFTWRVSGRPCNDTMQPAAWRMVNHLLQHVDLAAEYDELKSPVYGDQGHQADHYAFGSLRRAANKYFAEYGIPWRVVIKK